MTHGTAHNITVFRFCDPHRRRRAAEVFTFICGLTTKGFDITNTTATTSVGDCADEDAPAWNEEDVVSQSASVKGNGVFTREKQKELLDWVLNGTARNIRLYPGKSAAGDVDYFEGPAICKSLGLSVNRGERVQQAIELAFAAKPTAVLAT